MRVAASGGVLALVLAGCAAQPTTRDFVPIRQLVADLETAGTPVECSGYRSSDRTCESVATMRVEGDSLISAGKFLVSAEPEVVADASVRFAIVDGRACGNLGDTEMTGFGGGELEAFLVAVLKAALAEVGEVCFSYYDLGGGRYLSEGRVRETGALLPDGAQDVRFFASAPRLRPMQ